MPKPVEVVHIKRIKKEPGVHTITVKRFQLLNGSKRRLKDLFRNQESSLKPVEEDWFAGEDHGLTVGQLLYLDDFKKKAWGKEKK